MTIVAKWAFNMHGQITIPAKIRKKVNIKKGTQASIIFDGENIIIKIIPQKENKKITWKNIHKIFPTNVTLTDQELQQACSESFIPSEYNRD